MAKAKLTALTKSRIDNKTEKNPNTKQSKNLKIKTSENQKRKIQTLYLSRECAKLLWYHRADTGQTLSAAVESLVMKHLKKDKVG